jgi:5-methylthioadenosine/S-adenosylhomocysteine deaminase
MSAYDLVIHNAVIVTMDADDAILHGWVAVADGVIVALGDGPAPRAQRRVDAGGGIVHPGYVSAHQHSMDALARAGTDEAEGFFDWLFGTYYGTVIGYEAADASLAVALTARDLARAGVTTVLDCWGVGDVGSPRATACFEASVSAAAASGLRWILAPMVSDRVPDAWASLFAAAPATFRADALTAPTEVALAFASDAIGLARDRVEVWASIELPETASDELVAGVARLAESAGVGFTTHLCASDAGAVDITGERAVARLARLGALRRGTVGAHLTATDSADRALLRRLEVGGAHCPSATMVGGGDRSPLGELVAAGIPIGLGFDNATLNATADMGAEMRHALMFDRASGSGSVRARAREVLEFATLGGARALGREDRIGSVEPGKCADLVVVDTTGSHWQPPRDPRLGLVWQGRVDDIRLVFVDGEPVYEKN